MPQDKPHSHPTHQQSRGAQRRQTQLRELRPQKHLNYSKVSAPLSIKYLQMRGTVVEAPGRGQGPFHALEAPQAVEDAAVVQRRLG